MQFSKNPRGRRRRKGQFYSHAPGKCNRGMGSILRPGEISSAAGTPNKELRNVKRKDYLATSVINGGKDGIEESHDEGRLKSVIG